MTEIGDDPAPPFKADEANMGGSRPNDRFHPQTASHTPYSAKAATAMENTAPRGRSILNDAWAVLCLNANIPRVLPTPPSKKDTAKSTRSGMRHSPFRARSLSARMSKKPMRFINKNNAGTANNQPFISPPRTRSRAGTANDTGCPVVATHPNRDFRLKRSL